MEHTHLGHNWYLCDMDIEISDWILACLSECIDFVQPYDTMYLRAKQNLSGKKEFRVVFSARYNGYRFPVCYLLDLNTGKFKGNRMQYCIDKNGTHYSDRFPVYNDRFKFNHKSKYCREYRQLRLFLNSLEIPEHVPSSKERRTALKKSKRRRTINKNNTFSRRVGQKKKGILCRDIRVTGRTL
jgi:hypothetical protein